MKTQLSAFTFVVFASSISFYACKKQNNPIVNYDLEPKQSVFSVDYNVVPNNNVAKSIFVGQKIDNQRAALGRVLFYDTRLSLSGTVACASCHKQEIGFSDNVAHSLGFKGLGTTLNALPLSNLERDNVLFWNNRASTLEQLSLMPVENHLEMGFLQIEDVIARLSHIPYYVKNFKDVFGQAPSQTNVQMALGQFMRSLRSINSKYDQGYQNSPTTPFANFTPQENKGKELFFNTYNCNTCHGVASKIQQGWSETISNIGLDPLDGSDRDEVTMANFKVPSLRNIALTGPYMHDGRFKTLSEVIDHYSEGIEMNPNLSWNLRSFDNNTGESFAKKFHIPAEDKEALIAFLNTLTDFNYTQDKRYSNPFLP